MRALAGVLTYQLSIEFCRPCKNVDGFDVLVCWLSASPRSDGQSARVILHLPAVLRPQRHGNRLHGLLRRLPRERAIWGPRRCHLLGPGDTLSYGRLPGEGYIAAMDTDHAGRF